MKHTDHIYKEWDKFAGVWTTEGTIAPADEHAEIKITGKDTYTWILDNMFLLHEADVLMGDDKSQTYEIIGLDRLTGRCTMQYYNNRGDQGVMYASLENGIWTFAGEQLRFNGKFNEGATVFSGTWEQLDKNKNWVYFMKIRLTKEVG